MNTPELDQDRDSLLDALLREELGGEQPPDLRARILARSPFSARAKVTALASFIAVSAATVAMVVALWVLLGGLYPRPRIAGEYQLASGGSFARGAVVKTQEQPVEIALGGYVALRLAPNSELRVEGAPRAEEVYLARGQLACAVTPQAGEFAVKTDAATVRVTGTEFVVRVFEEKGVEKMFARRTFVRVLAGTVVVSGLWGSASFAAGHEGTVPPAATTKATAKTPSETPHKATAAAPVAGKLTGILLRKEAGKTNGYIVVKAEGETEGKTYIPLWRGGSPDQGGGADAAMLETIRKTGVNNLVEIEWKTDEHLRVVSLRTIVPAETTGTVEGKVVAKEANWVDVKPADGPTERYVPRWIPNADGKGGAMDKEMIARIATLEKGDTVRVAWKYEERKRLVELTKLASAPETRAAPAEKRK